MNSFISNFRSEIKVLVVPVVLLLACEIGLRMFGDKFSSDLNHVNGAAAAARAALAGRGGPSIVFLGNSLTRLGVDVQEIQRDLQSAGAEQVRTVKFCPGDTVIVDWYYLFKSVFIRQKLLPNIVVIGFAGDHLDDAANVHPSRLARYGGFENMAELFRDDIQDLAGRLDYLGSRLSLDIAYRDRVRTGLLVSLIPGYREAANQVNQNTKQHATSAARRLPPQHECLRRFVSMCGESSILPVVVAMPLSYSYEVPDSVRELVEQAGGVFLDLRHVPGITGDLFPDGVHMNAKAAGIYSRDLAGHLETETKTCAIIRPAAARIDSPQPGPRRPHALAAGWPTSP